MHIASYNSLRNIRYNGHMHLTPQRVRQLTQLSFTLEPLLNKNGCTTRYADLPGKPLVDFIIAGVNVGTVIEDFAEEAINGEMRMFSHFKPAILASNDFKNAKLINTGLLHFIFITICVRLKSKNLADAIENYIPVMQATTNKDAQDFVNGLEVSWSTSASKIDWLQSRREVLPNVSSYYELQSTLYKNSQDHTTSSYYVTKLAFEGFPIIGRFINDIEEEQGLLKSIENTYNKLHAENPNLQIGILADLSATALFLYLSFQDPDTYVIL